MVFENLISSFLRGNYEIAMKELRRANNGAEEHGAIEKAGLRRLLYGSFG